MDEEISLLIKAITHLYGGKSNSSEESRVNIKMQDLAKDLRSRHVKLVRQ